MPFAQYRVAEARTGLVVPAGSAKLAGMVLPLLTNEKARRLFLDRHLLLGQGSGPAGGAGLSELLTGLGFVQVDSVNTLARSHDLILWSRRGRYRPQALVDLVARDRAAFEHWTHDAAVVPMPFYPMWRLKFARDAARMRRHWPACRREGWDARIATVLQQITDHGPAGSMDVGRDEARGSAGWWDWHPSKTALEYLWRSGRLAVCHRAGFRKVYDLAERVIPAACRDVRLDPAQIIDWALSAALDRLGFATSGELAAFFAIATPEEAKRWCTEARAARRIVEIEVEMADGSRRRSFSSPALLERVSALPAPSSRVRLLSPFDPALRDRARAERLFGFRYRIEIFVPAPRRRFGYYVFPVMQGSRLIGRIDAKREAGVLALRAFWPEAGVSMTKARQAGLLAELHRVLPLAEAAEIRLAPDWLRG